MRVTLAEDVVWRDLAGEVAILSLGTKTYFGLNTVASRMWCLIAEFGSLDTVVSALLDEYEAEEPRIRSDLEQFVADLQAKGLVVTIDDQAVR